MLFLSIFSLVGVGTLMNEKGEDKRETGRDKVLTLDKRMEKGKAWYLNYMYMNDIWKVRLCERLMKTLPRIFRFST